MASSYTIQETLGVLGYLQSENFLPGDSPHLASVVDYAHVFRKAIADCDLRGIYLLRPDSDLIRSVTPIVYVCEAQDETAADKIHKRVWNQNIVPFILVHTQRSVRLYSGFKYGMSGTPDADRGVLRNAIAFNEIANQLHSFTANAIDAGRLWKEWGYAVTPDSRVDLKLLANLRELDEVLRKEGLDRTTSHALIGKYVYLRYLRDRSILSDRKLERWGIEPAEVFTRNATLNSFWKMNDELEDWLNGAVFPLTTRKDAIKEPHVKQVAGVFFGDEPTGQLHLPFRAYDFAFIPTETISSIYEQFLHSPEEGEQSKGKQSGAYYTPVPLINFVLNELDDKRPLKEGMTVLDPACGSGAFLVQSYRRLISGKKRQTQRDKLRPTELRDLLTKHIYGVELDGDACQITALSLILTLLDCVEPPDLKNTSFKLPSLLNENIFEADFFDPDSIWVKKAGKLTFDWIVGNPPWKDLNANKAAETDIHAWEWMKSNSSECPVGGYQIAEAFVWKTIPAMNKDAAAGLILPAMTLFKRESEAFRRKFFQTHSAWCVANFANLAYVLFGGRAKRPAAVVFYHKSVPEADARILTYAPFVVNQEANRSTRRLSGKKSTWNIVVNSSELREMDVADAATGDMLPWKLAMWGSYRDERLLTRIGSTFPTFHEFAAKHNIVAHEGIGLRTSSSSESVEHVPALKGKYILNLKKLRNCKPLFTFHSNVLDEIDESKCYVRKGRARFPVAVSTPPHIIIDAARRFSVYSDDFVLVPSRQIGIASSLENKNLLIALSLYLNSSFAKYYQFFFSPGWGIGESIALLDALQTLPIPLDKLTPAELGKWISLHKSLVVSSVNPPPGDTQFASSLATLNSWVFALLDLRPQEAILIEEFVEQKLQTLQGKVTAGTIRPPSPVEVTKYLEMLQKELDDFIGQEDPHGHRIEAVQGKDSSMIRIKLVGAKQKNQNPVVHIAGTETSRHLDQIRLNLLKRHSQWLYFDRALKIYEGATTYLFKPMERIHWTQTQALLDADELIAETLTATEG